MTLLDDQHSSDTMVIAENILSRALGGKVRLGGGDGLGGSDRSKVYRFSVLEGPREAPASIVVKRATTHNETYNPDAPEFLSPAWRLYNDWAGLQFLSQVAGDASPGPRFCAGDRDAGLIVMEDLGVGESLDNLLLGTDPVFAEEALMELAAMLGRLHALTAGKQAEFDRIRDALGSRAAGTDFYSYEWIAAAFHTTAETLNSTPYPGVDDALETLIASLRSPGPFLAYTHGDPCPDNCLRVASKMKLLDFEFGEFRHALIDGVYGRIHFPTCWCVNRIPEHIPLRMEATYRAELVKGCPEAADDAKFYRAVVEACAYWVLTMCQWHCIPDLLEKDDEWGIATLRQRVLVRFGILAQTTEEFGHLEAIGATFRDMAAKLRIHWPPAADAMPYYPAFR